MMQAIETDNLSKKYGRFAALDRVSLSVPASSVFALLGASGAGKTTLIRLLLNLSVATRGKAKVLGVDSTLVGPGVLTQIGYVSESQVMPPRLRVSDFFVYIRSRYRTWDQTLEVELRNQLRLPPKRRIGELSHGMRLKMALACALPFRPKLLILDEPLSGLDALARDEIIEGVLRQAGQTSILISSHELDEMERFATHVAFLHDGRLLFQGSVAQLAEHARPLLVEICEADAREIGGSTDETIDGLLVDAGEGHCGVPDGCDRRRVPYLRIWSLPNRA